MIEEEIAKIASRLSKSPKMRLNGIGLGTPARQLLRRLGKEAGKPVEIVRIHLTHFGMREKSIILGQLQEVEAQIRGRPLTSQEQPQTEPENDVRRRALEAINESGIRQDLARIKETLSRNLRR